MPLPKQNNEGFTTKRLTAFGTTLFAFLTARFLETALRALNRSADWDDSLSVAPLSAIGFFALVFIFTLTALVSSRRYLTLLPSGILWCADSGIFLFMLLVFYGSELPGVVLSSLVWVLRLLSVYFASLAAAIPVRTPYWWEFVKAATALVVLLLAVWRLYSI